MPDKPTWCCYLDAAIEELRNLSQPWVDRGMIERLLHIGRRRAQQLMQPCVHQFIGASGIADREELIAHLRSVASQETVYYETKRREQFARVIDDLRRDWMTQPKALVEAPTSIINQELTDLPEGVTLEPGRLTVTFETAAQALEKLLAIAIAASNDLDGFEKAVQISDTRSRTGS